MVLGVGTAEGGPVKTPEKGFLTEGGTGSWAKLDIEGLQNLHRPTGADVATATADDTDVRWVSQRIRSNYARRRATEGDRWRDTLGWWLSRAGDGRPCADIPRRAAVAYGSLPSWRCGCFLPATQGRPNSWICG